MRNAISNMTPENALPIAKPISAPTIPPVEYPMVVPIGAVKKNDKKPICHKVASSLASLMRRDVSWFVMSN
jgi:hypothetical protein